MSNTIKQVSSFDEVVRLASTRANDLGKQFGCSVSYHIEEGFDEADGPDGEYWYVHYVFRGDGFRQRNLNLAYRLYDEFVVPYGV